MRIMDEVTTIPDAADKGLLREARDHVMELREQGE